MNNQTTEPVFDFDKFAATAKQKTFIFRCTSCKRAFKDEAAQETLESECPNCGEWNYSNIKE